MFRHHAGLIGMPRQGFLLKPVCFLCFTGRKHLFGGFIEIAFDQTGSRGDDHSSAHDQQYGGHPDISSIRRGLPGYRYAGQCKEKHPKHKYDYQNVSVGGMVPWNNCFSEYRIRHWPVVPCRNRDQNAGIKLD